MGGLSKVLYICRGSVCIYICWTVNSHELLSSYELLHLVYSLCGTWVCTSWPVPLIGFVCYFSSPLMDNLCVWAQIMKLLLSTSRTMNMICLASFLCFSFLSQDAGIWFVFHSSSTGDSHGLVPETKAELTPLGIFYNNRVHSNFKVFIFKLFYY